ncbi:MAG: NUDIX hydrolase [Cyclobacteriaceae bacterium]|jgi:8-oxo-dGTP diphosphatase|nr:NUDIX hydrolase [Cyclobacteriaceae bacterium]
MDHPVHKFYGNRLRVRVCGVCIRDQRLLLINHRMAHGPLWAPPGGGLEFGESAPACLAREFREETGLTVEVRDFLFACELLHPPLHAVELFFGVEVVGGILMTGHDPEAGSPAVIEEVAWLSATQVLAHPPAHRHRLFGQVADPLQIASLRGYFRL